MKRVSISFLIVVFSIVANGKGKYPNSFLNIGIGFGPNYGIIGTKTVLGYKNNGLFLGGGVFSGNFIPSIGIQVSKKWFFLNMCYGAYGIERFEGNKQLLQGLIISTGGMINIGSFKRMFLDLGISYCNGGKVPIDDYGILNRNAILFNVGYGFRIGNY